VGKGLHVVVTVPNVAKEDLVKVVADFFAKRKPDEEPHLREVFSRARSLTFTIKSEC
jgi:hypothetical protein